MKMSAVRLTLWIFKPQSCWALFTNKSILMIDKVKGLKFQSNNIITSTNVTVRRARKWLNIACNNVKFIYSYWTASINLSVTTAQGKAKPYKDFLLRMRLWLTGMRKQRERKDQTLINKVHRETLTTTHTTSLHSNSTWNTFTEPFTLEEGVSYQLSGFWEVHPPEHLQIAQWSLFYNYLILSL